VNAHNDVPVIITCDVDPTPESTISDKRDALEKTSTLFDEFGIKSTFFVVANIAKDYRPQIRDLLNKGHEIGCHGLSHDENEEYNNLPEETQRDYLTSATKILADITGQAVTSFRGPRVKTSHITQQILEELHYKADASVCSQRLDLLSSNLINTKWIFAPRLPYHPHHQNAFRRGERNLWVVPVSAIVLPFVSGMLYTFGLTFTKLMFRLLYKEARQTGKPIVYLLHPVEFAPKTVRREKRYPLLVEGFRFRRSPLIFEQDIERRHAAHEALFSYMNSFEHIRYRTMLDYCKNGL